MATQLQKREHVNLIESRRTLTLIWQNPATRRFVKVGRFDALPSGSYAFQYLPSAFEDRDFAPLEEYPERLGVYVSDEVPAFFANRIRSAERPDYEKYLSWLGVDKFDADVLPFEVLARTGGTRATDTFHVVEVPETNGGRYSIRFFVSGIRYTDERSAIVESLRPGDELVLQPERTNKHNASAVMVKSNADQKIGYVPDWLCDDITSRAHDGWKLTAVAERVNPDAPAHVRVLCRIDGMHPTARESEPR